MGREKTRYRESRWGLITVNHFRDGLKYAVALGQMAVDKWRGSDEIQNRRLSRHDRLWNNKAC